MDVDVKVGSDGSGHHLSLIYSWLSFSTQTSTLLLVLLLLFLLVRYKLNAC